MKTPFLKNHFLFSCGDHPGKIATMAYTDVTKCNLKCMECHNREAIKRTRESLMFCSEDEFEKNITAGELLGSDILVISGGEPTMQTDKIIEVLKNRKVNLPIRIDTNGQLPEQLQKLKEYVSGFAIDIKIPIKDEYTVDEKKRFSKILGISGIEVYANKLKKSISVADGMMLTLFRTVKYPYLSDSDIDHINNFVATMYSPHYWNPYYDNK